MPDSQLTSIPVGGSTFPNAGASMLMAGLDTIGNTVSSIVNTNKTIKANKEMARYAYSKDLDMWNLQNQYNAPAQQMQRFKEAGLNPLLIYGQGTPGNASQLPKYQAPRMEYNYSFKPNIVDNLQRFQDINIKQQQSGILDQELRKKSAEADMVTNKNIQWAMEYPLMKKFFPKKYEGYYQKTNLDFARNQQISQSMNMITDPANPWYKARMSILQSQITKYLYENQKLAMQNRWMPWEKGFGLATKGLAGIGGIMFGKGIGSSIGRAASGIGKPKYNPAPKWNWGKKNYDLNPNLNF